MNNSIVSIIKSDDYTYSESNISDLVSKALFALGLDTDNYGKNTWNPFGEIIKPGMNVLIKPNLVMDKNHIESNGSLCLYTQPEVVSAVVDHVIKALCGHGKIVIGDAPMQECDFDNLIKNSGYEKIVEKYIAQGIDIRLVDFRELKSKVKNGIHYIDISEGKTGTVVQLNQDSEFYKDYGDQCSKYRITNYDPSIMLQHHNDTIHEYYISNYVLNADIIINMPKPKTHRKAGVTIALKNFVGVNTRKEFLPHHTKGSMQEGGDEYEKKNFLQTVQGEILDRKNLCVAQKKYTRASINNIASKLCSRILSRNKSRYYEGSWYGNHTISRTIVDLNKIVKYADKHGVMQEEPQRKIIIIADMVVSGEKEGPVCPSPKNVGIIAAGMDPVVFDETIATIMGFDPLKIPTIVQAKDLKGKFGLYNQQNKFIIVSNDEKYNSKSYLELNYNNLLHYEPTSGWKGHIELEE